MNRDSRRVDGRPVAGPSPAGTPLRVSRTDRLRLLTSALMLVLGLVIVAQGLRLLLPWPYTLTGLLMFGLGAYRLRLAWVLWQRAASPPPEDHPEGGPPRPGRR